jgi:4a-hydroxytetrahydrobiopterin dehydratase
MARLSDAEIEERLASSQWKREGDQIVRYADCGGFMAAMDLANAVADAANAANHHPNILVHDYNHLRLELSTHSEGGITENDFALAQTIDGLIAEADG